MVAAYRESGRMKGMAMTATLITKLGRAGPKKIAKIIVLGLTLKNGLRTSWPTSIVPVPAMAPPRPSSVDSKISGARPSGSGTRPTTSSGRHWIPADSNPVYSLDCEEQVLVSRASVGSDAAFWGSSCHRLQHGNRNLTVPDIGTEMPGISRRDRADIPDSLSVLSCISNARSAQKDA